VARFARSAALFAALFAALTVVMTWPQAARLASSAQPHQDVYFNMWRFAWFAHALASAPSQLLDGNIFYPEPRALTLSDAMPVEALIASPLLWSGLPPVLVHNLLLLAGIIFSAAGIAALATRLTGSPAAGISAGIIFAFAPYRFEHYMHMELQWTVWIPWAFWALHRVIARGRLKDGVLLGVFSALQFLSSIYYGIFLFTLIGLSGVLLLCGLRRDAVKRISLAFAVAGVVAGVSLAPYLVPYTRTRAEVGSRPVEHVLQYGARPSSYLAATNSNLLYGKRSERRRPGPERRLFPGVLAVLLALVGLLLKRPTDEAIVYVIAMVAAFEMSLGLRGYSFAFLYEHVPLFTALRAPARLGIFVVFFLALLAAYGQAALEHGLSKWWRTALSGFIAAVLLLEYWVAPLRLDPFPNTPPPLYAWLAQQDRGAVVEFPMPLPDSLPGHEPRYAYMSTFHWMPLLNGYSGYYPPSYLSVLGQLRHFPDEHALAVLRRRNIRYVIVHTSLYAPDRAGELLTRAAGSGSLTQLGHFHDGQGDAVVFALR
jgi:hypothetical protein